jgi:ABC-2 type transport system permease protein
MKSVTALLIRKELYVNRWLVLGATVAGVLTVGIASFGKTAFNVGALGWLTAIIAHGVMLAIYGVMNERKEHTLQFVLSLPLSGGDYVRAKLAGLLICFVFPWLISSLGALALIAFDADIPDGMLPFTILLCVFMLANFSLVLSGTLHAMSEGVVTAVIVVTNMGVSLFMFTVGAMPEFQNHLGDPGPSWSATFWTVLGIESDVFLIAMTLPLLFAARRRDFL